MTHQSCVPGRPAALTFMRRCTHVETGVLRCPGRVEGRTGGTGCARYKRRRGRSRSRGHDVHVVQRAEQARDAERIDGVWWHTVEAADRWLPGLERFGARDGVSRRPPSMMRCCGSTARRRWIS